MASPRRGRPAPWRALHARVARRWAGLALALLIGAATPAPGGAQPATAPARSADSLHTVTLPNGLDVLVVENHSVPLATAMLVVRTGAMAQGDEEQGIPHLFEHMLFKGYRGSAGESFGSEAAALQAGYNGTTGEEVVTYYLTLPSASTADGVRLLAGLARDAEFSADDLRTERFVVLDELKRGTADPRDVLAAQVDEHLWGAGWPRKNTIGNVTALLGVTPERLRAIYRRYYVPNNAALIVTGDVSTAEVVAAARRHFGGWRRQPDPYALEPIPALPALDSAQAVVVTGDVGAVTIRVAWRGPSVRHDTTGTYDADVLADLLNDEQSAFTQRLVDDGAFQSARFGYQTLAHGGPLLFVGTTTPERLAEALAQLSAELQRMRVEEYFSPTALAAAAKRRRVARVLDREEGVTLAHALADAWAITGLPYHASYADRLAERRPADLARFVGRYIAARPLVLGMLTPPALGAAAGEWSEQFLELVRDMP